MPHSSVAADRLARSTSERAFVVAACALFLTLSILAIRTQSLTDNEELFIPAGVSYFQRHDARMDIEEPPLSKVLAAIPVLLLQPKVDYSDPSWTSDPGSYQPEYDFGQKFFESWNPNHGTMLFLARLPMIGMTLLLGLSLYGMARRFGGFWGGALTLALFVTSPFFLSYGSIVHMDIGIALFSLWTMWSFANLWQEPTFQNALWFALSLAGALLMKFSAVFLFPALFLAWIWFRFKESGSLRSVLADSGERFKRERLIILGMLLAGAVVFICYSALFYRTYAPTMLLNEAYNMGFAGHRTIPVDVFARRMLNHPALTPLLLAPSLYIGGLSYVIGHGSRPFYFLGHTYPHGVWFYFPVISFFKLAPGMILALFLLAIVAAATFFRSNRNRPHLEGQQFHLPAIVSAIVVFAGIAMASDLNVGVRHFSVPIALLTLLCSLLVPTVQSLSNAALRRTLFAGMAILVFSSFVTAVLAYPDYLAYFNCFRGSMPKQEIAENSNLNWGQAANEVAAFFRSHGVTSPYMDDVSIVDPAIYLPGARSWHCETPGQELPEWLAVSPYKLNHGPGNCSDLERYPAWTIAHGAVVIFHIQTSPLPQTEHAVSP